MVFLSCHSVTEPPGYTGPTNLGPVPNGPFTTDVTGYIARLVPGSAPQTQYRFTVISRYENRGSVSLYLGRCFPTSPQPLWSVGLADTSETGFAYVQIWACVGHDQQFELAPGAVRVDTLQILGPNAFDHNTHQPLNGITNGQFCLYYDVRLAPGDGAASAPMSVRLSNAFVVRTSN